MFRAQRRWPVSASFHPEKWVTVGFLQRMRSFLSEVKRRENAGGQRRIAAVRVFYSKSSTGMGVVPARVIRDYSAQYPDPISVRAGETIHLGQRDTDYPGWIWATSVASGK